MTANTTVEASPKPAAPLDPLAAMMAPPPRVPHSSKKHTFGGQARGNASTTPAGAPPTAPPQFAVFQAKPVTK